MCGFTLYFYTDSTAKNQDGQFPVHDLEPSLEMIHHRGPDSRGIYISPDGRCGLGHARLSIIDLAGGQQPLSSQCNKIHAVVNGELYDHDRLSRELEENGHKFKTHSDSEMALHYYEDYDTDFVEYLRGEFAVAIWDERKGRMTVARDRFGIKPVYYTTINGTFLAASEIKAFLALGWKPEWDIDSLVHSGAITDYRTCFKGVYKIPPGHYMTITSDGCMSLKKYWDATYPNKNEQDTRTVDEMILGVRERLVEAVRLRLRADVPLGIYLSGGIDSSCIAGVASALLRQENPNARLDAFSISFSDGAKYDEGEIAERTAAFCGANFHKMPVTEQDLVDNFTDTIWHIEQPMNNMNGVGKFLLSRHVRDLGCKVVMTGEGSDEHFIGYEFFYTDYLREADKNTPGGFGAPDEDTRKKLLAKRLEAPTSMGFSMDTANDKKSKDRWNGIYTQDHFGKWAGLSDQGYFVDPVTDRFGENDCGSAMLEALHADTRSTAKKNWHPVHASLYLESRTFLPNYLLNTLGDRSEMSHSIEARTPFLDHHLCEYVNNLPPSVKLRYDGGRLNEKWILKEAMKPYISDEIYNRTKHHFLAPPSDPNQEMPVYKLIKKYLTKDKVDRLGWANWPYIEEQRNYFLKTADKWTYKNLLIIISYIVISERFVVATANI